MCNFHKSGLLKEYLLKHFSIWLCKMRTKHAHNSKFNILECHNNFLFKWDTSKNPALSLDPRTAEIMSWYNLLLENLLIKVLLSLFIVHTIVYCSKSSTEVFQFPEFDYKETSKNVSVRQRYASR